jgi:methionine-rich copper-binding protein CopC
MKRPVAVALVTGAWLALALGTMSPAAAAPLFATHNVLIASVPAAGQTLTTLPDTFSITTNENLLDFGGHGNGFALQVRDAAGQYYGTGCVTIVDASMSAPAALGAAGDYTMLWQAVSADGHTVSGAIPFTWAPSNSATPSAGSPAPIVCGAAAPTGSATPAATPNTDAPPGPIALSDVLWIGGAVVAVGIAVLVVILIAGRRDRR